MCNRLFRLAITAEDLYNSLSPEQKEQIGDIVFTKSSLIDNSTIEIECIATKEEIKEYPYCIKYQDFHKVSY